MAQPFVVPGVSFRKTRLAPTPSGYLHAGNALNFLLTAALAQQCGASILLRIDDLDRERYRPAYAADIFETLRFLDLSWNEGPRDVDDLEQRWAQRHRLPLYNEALEKLKAVGAVFACTCSRSQREDCNCEQKMTALDTPGASWRLRTGSETLAVTTADGTAVAAALPESVRNFVVRKKDGLPAYQLSSLVDDLHFGIDFVVRGEDLWPSTLAQLYLAHRLGDDRFARIRFLHHPLLTNNGEKLSKSAGDTAVKHWREAGKTGADFRAYLNGLLSAQLPMVTTTGTPFRFV